MKPHEVDIIAKKYNIPIKELGGEPKTIGETSNDLPKPNLVKDNDSEALN